MINFKCAKMIKEVLDKKFGPSWHVVVGEGFGFEISYEVSFFLYLFKLFPKPITKEMFVHSRHMYGPMVSKTMVSK